MQQHLQNKKGLVKNVFDQVYDQYDLMNDVMSFGIHRLWKKSLIYMMNPSSNQKLIDVACGTGDIANLILDHTNKSLEITCVDPNKKMIGKGKEKLKNFKNLNWITATAEKLPINNNSFDFYTISFGLRNTKNLDLAIKEAYRVLKPGGRFFCLEFSKVDNEIINFFYQNYSKIIPFIGKYVVGSSIPYEYLIKSIDKFYAQEELANLIKKSGFFKVEYRNLSGGISAIHSGWKI